MNLAQQFYFTILGDETLLKLHSRGKSLSFTKKGPGRTHQQGKVNVKE